MPSAALLAFAIALMAGALLFTLFVRSKDVPAPEPPTPAAHLQQRKAQIYENLRDLQFEYRVGKLSDQDYQTTKLELQKELARVMAEIDQVEPPPAMAKAVAAPVSKPQAAAPPANVCPHCGAKFPSPMKFCGECGKAMQS